MTDEARAPWHLWLVGLVSLLWHTGGAFDYTMTHLRDEAYLRAAADNAGVPYDVMLGYFTGFPLWAHAGWAFGVWGAVAGSLLLLARSRFAVHAFALSLAGLAVSTLHQAIGDMPAALDTPFTWIFTAVIVAVTLGLILYARRMVQRGVLR